MKGAHKLLASAVRNKLEAVQGRYREKKQDSKECRQQMKQAREKIEEGICFFGFFFEKIKTIISQ